MLLFYSTPTGNLEKFILHTGVATNINVVST